MTSASWNVTGLLMVLVGVLILFRYGMPYRVRTGGAIHIIAEQLDQNDIKAERWYTILGWIGLILVVAGTACQIKGNLP